MVKLTGVLTVLSASLTVSLAATTIKYMPFGDSITEIVCWRGLVWDMVQKAGYTQVDFVGSGKQQSNAGCKTTPANYDKDNEGHSGFLAIDIANKKQLVGWLKTNTPDIITMHLGTNDIVQQSKGTTDIIAAFTTLVDQMRAANPHIRIIVRVISWRAVDKKRRERLTRCDYRSPRSSPSALVTMVPSMPRSTVLSQPGPSPRTPRILPSGLLTRTLVSRHQTFVIIFIPTRLEMLSWLRNGGRLLKTPSS
jgi:hypothetical protein